MSTVSPPDLNLRALADLYEATLKVRNAAANRLRAVDQGADEDPGSPPVANSPLVDRLNAALDQAREDMEGALADHPVYEWLMGIPGINRTLGCRIIGMIPMESEEDFTTFSKLRVFAGICPGRNRLTKGEKAHFCRRLKTALYVAFGNMLKAAAVCQTSKTRPARFYAEIYQTWRVTYKERYGEGKEAKEQGWPDLRQHFAAKNKLLDVFLSHLWTVWRESEGWSTRPLYVYEHLGHHMMYDRNDFRSEDMAIKKMRQHGRKSDVTHGNDRSRADEGRIGNERVDVG